MTLAADEFIGNMHIFEMTPRDLLMGGGSIYHLDLLCCCSHDNGLSSVALPTVS